VRPDAFFHDTDESKCKNWKTSPNVNPADKSLKKIKARLTELSQRKLTVLTLKDEVGNMSRSLRGWANYFHYRNSSLGMNKVSYHAECWLRNHLMKRYKVKHRKLDTHDFRTENCMNVMVFVKHQ
jgi:RNA-directed DNA polymerase